MHRGQAGAEGRLDKVFSGLSQEDYVLVGDDLAVVAFGEVEALVPHVAVKFPLLYLFDGQHLPSVLVDC